MRNDKPTNKGRHLNSRHIRPTIGFLTHGLLDNYSMLLWNGVMDATQEEDANLICFLGRSLESPRGFEAQANILYDLVSAETVDGLVLSSSALSHFVGQEGLRTFCERYAPLPMVSIAVPLEGIHSIVVSGLVV